MKRLATVALALALLGGHGDAYVHLRTTNGSIIRWFNAGVDVSFTLNSQGSGDVPDASDDLALRLAFQQWEAAEGSTLSFDEVTDPIQRARTDWQSNDIQLVLFDEDGSTGAFGTNSSIIAFTFVQFSTATGRIVDADMLWNGQLFAGGPIPYSTDLTNGTIDIQNVATHEVGHFVGFEHDPIGGATMTPIATTKQFALRSLSVDDAAGVRDKYPLAADVPAGGITGRVVRASDGSPVGGANVWARDAGGRVRAAAMSENDGTYVLTGLPDGSFTVTAGPIDGPTVAGNFDQGLGLPGIDTDFSTTAQTGVVVAAGGFTAAGDLVVDPAAAVNIEGPVIAVSIRQGASKFVSLQGNSLGAGAGTMPSVPDGGGLVKASGASAAGFTVTVDAAAPAGLYDLAATGPSGHDVASGFLEVLPPAPNVTGVVPALGSTLGGNVVTVSGSNFGETPLVVFGDQPGTLQQVSSDAAEQAVVVVPSGVSGSVDVVVINTAGETAVLVDGYDYVSLPVPSGLFPVAGSSAGGTVVTVVGGNFAPTISALFDGIPAADTTWVDAGRLLATTPALSAGVVDVALFNEVDLGVTLVAAYQAVDETDPVVISVSPELVPMEGGTEVTVTGAGFAATPAVVFGADELGLGGVAGTGVVLDSADTLRVITPASAPGDKAVLVTNPLGAAGLAAGVITFAPTLVGKDKFAGAIDAPGDVDAVFMQTLGGTFLTVTLKRSKKSALTPRVTVRDEGGAALVSTDPADPSFDAAFVKTSPKQALLKKWPVPDLPVASTFTIEVGGLSDSVGGYLLRIKEKLPAALLKIAFPAKAATPVGPGASLLIPLVVKAGSTLSGKLSSKDGVLPVVSGFSAGGGADLLADADVLAAILPSAKGTSVRFKKLPLAAFGSHELAIGTSGTEAGTIKGKLSIRPPKSKLTFKE